MILGRSGGASLAKLGSLAVLGNLAYQAYQNYQKSQQSSQPNISENAFDVLNSSSHVDAGELILRTMMLQRLQMVKSLKMKNKLSQMKQATTLN